MRMDNKHRVQTDVIEKQGIRYQHPELWHNMRYQSVQMYDRETKDLFENEKNEARKFKQLERQRKKDDRERHKELHKKPSKFSKSFSWFWSNTFARMGEDWIFLALLGCSMALVSFCLDNGIRLCTKARIYLYRDLTEDPITQYFAWITLPICLILFSVSFVHLVSPQAIGSGIPEMKTILRGVNLNEYLTFRTLVSKVIGLTAALGSGMPLGMESPFVHIACNIGQCLSKFVTSFRGIYENESRNHEMLAAACAVGIAACFAAPVGGVLFSIEVTTTYFAVRNYWRGFFAGICGATFFRLLPVFFGKKYTIVPLFPTNFEMNYSYYPQELIMFAIVGVICGLCGALYVWSHRNFVMFMKTNKALNNFLSKNRFIWPGVLALIFATIIYPNGLGKFVAGELGTHEQVDTLFTNFTWSSRDHDIEQSSVLKHWTNPITNEYFSVLFLYTIFQFFGSIITSTIPVPCGLFIPTFKSGAAIGRIIGEALYLWFPTGISYGGHTHFIIPGVYAVVGSAALAGSVSHTVSVAVIVFEMTGQIGHLVPVMIASLIACAVATFFQPSLYDSIILIKKLPFLPDLLPKGSGMFRFIVGDFMVRDVRYIWQNISYFELKDILKKNKHLRSFPLVDHSDTMILLGSVQRYDLIKVIDNHIGRQRRLEIAALKMQTRQIEEQQRLNRKEETKWKRYEFVSSPDILKLQELASNEMLTPQAKKEMSKSQQFVPCQPHKSILKKPSSTSITGSECRLRTALETFFGKSIQDVQNDPEIGSKSNLHMSNIDGLSTPPSQGNSKKVQLPSERIIDMSLEEQRAWEREELQKPINFYSADIHIDPSPFQLVEQTSLLKVHTLFTMLGINHAYVTNVGKLVGVVALKELRKAIEDANSGNFVSKSEAQIKESETEPLLNEHSLGNEKDENYHTIKMNSVDSILKSSETCSTDIELDNVKNELKKN